MNSNNLENVSQDGYALSQTDGSNSQFQEGFLYNSAMHQGGDSESAILDRQRLYSDCSNTQTSNLSNAQPSQGGGLDDNPNNTSITLNNFSHIFKSKITVDDNSNLTGHKRTNLNSPAAEDDILTQPYKKLDVMNSSEKNRQLERSTSFTAAIAETIVLDGGVNQLLAEASAAAANFVKKAPQSHPPPHVGRLQTDFTIVDVIGSGVFGKVYKVTGNIDKNSYAIKVSRRSFRGEQERISMVNEVFVLAALSSHEVNNSIDSSSGVAINNNNIIRYFSTWIEESHVYIQMELCDRSVEAIFNQHLLDSSDHMSGGDNSSKPVYPFSLTDVMNISRDMLNALNFLHSCQYAHLDIKPGNILIKGNVYKLSDFGLAIHVGNGTASSVISSSSSSSSSSSYGSTSSGAAAEEGDTKYMARELLDWGYKDLKKCDMFSLGLSLYELCCGTPLPGDGPEWQALRKGEYNREPGQINSKSVASTPPVAPMSSPSSGAPGAPGAVDIQKSKCVVTGADFMAMLADLLKLEPADRPSPSACLAFYPWMKSPLEQELEVSNRKLSNLVKFNAKSVGFKAPVGLSVDTSLANRGATMPVIPENSSGEAVGGAMLVSALIPPVTVGVGTGYTTPRSDVVQPNNALSNSFVINVNASSGNTLKRSHTVQ